jgi:hypothetical protein
VVPLVMQWADQEDQVDQAAMQEAHTTQEIQGDQVMVVVNDQVVKDLVVDNNFFVFIF